MDLDVYMALQFVNRVTTWLQSHPYPRGRIVAVNFGKHVSSLLWSECYEGKMNEKRVIDIDAIQ